MTTDWDIAKAYSESPWEQAQAVPVEYPDPEEFSAAFDAVVPFEEAPTKPYVRPPAVVRVTTDLSWVME